MAFDAEHIAKRKHKATEADARQYIKKALFSLNRKGKKGEMFRNYYNDEGAAYTIDLSLIRTAFTKDEYDDTIKKAIKAYKGE